MKFEEYAWEWLDRQVLIKSTRKTTRQALDVYILTVIGNTEIEEISEENIDSIFASKRLFERGEDFTERTFRVLINIFDELSDRHLISKDSVLHVYSPVVLANEMLILEGPDVELSSDSPFVQVSFMLLKSQNYKKVTYALYLHFLTSFIHPFIGKKPIGLVGQNNIRNIYTYFNTVATNQTWIGQIHLVMRMVFDYAMESHLVSSNPMLKINDPHLQPIIPLEREKNNAVRAAFSRYGFRKNRLKELS